MFKQILTFTDYLLQEDQKAKSASGSFPLLLTQIANAAKVIASQLAIAGLVDLLGKTGGVNMFGDEGQKLDAFANQLLVESLIGSGTVHAVMSEELEVPVFAPSSCVGDISSTLIRLMGRQTLTSTAPLEPSFLCTTKMVGFFNRAISKLPAAT